jgi:hypothetical protein
MTSTFLGTAGATKGIVASGGEQQADEGRNNPSLA